MKNFTKTITNKTLFKTTRWLIMALMLLVGTSSAWGWTVYYDNTKTQWTDVYIVLGHGSYMKSYQMTAVADNLFSYSRNDYSDATYIAFSNSHTSSSGTTSPSWTDINYIYFGFGMSILDGHTFTIREEKPIDITYIDEILSGETIGFYVGEYQDWNNKQFYVHTGNSDHIVSHNPFSDGTTSHYGVIYATSKDYHITHSTSWGGPTIGEPANLGTAYLVTSDNSVSSSAGTALSCDFSIDNTIQAGETSTVSITSSGRSKYGTTDYTIDSYYAKKADESDLLEISVDNNELQTQDLEVGIYTIYALLFDGRIYAKGGEQTLTVETACDKPDAPTITINDGTSAKLCSGSATITVDGYNNANTYTLYQDDNAQGASISNTGTFTVSEAGTYYVTVTTCAESDPSAGVTLEYYSAPTLNNKYSKTNSTACGNTPHNNGTVTITPETGETYTLTSENTSYNRDGNTWSNLSPGNYVLTATSTNCGNLSVNESIAITEEDKTPTLNDISINGEESVCQGGNLTLQLNGNAQDGVTYTWYKDNKESTPVETGSSLNLSNIQNDATYFLVASKTSAEGCPASKETSIDITVNPLPDAPSLANPAPVCEGTTTVNLPIGYNWYDAETDGNKVADTAIEATGTYWAAAVENGCESATRARYDVTVNPLPTITSISASNDEPVPFEDVVLTATGVTQGAEVKWYLDNDETPVATGTTYVVTSENAGEVTVKAKAFLNGCESAVESRPVTFSAAEDCTPTPDNTKIEIWCQVTGTTTPYCHAFNITPSGNNGFANWPGLTHTSKSGDYYIWTLDNTNGLNISNNKVGIVFSKNSSGDNQTADITTLYVGNRYYFTYNANSNDKNTNYTQVKSEPLTTPVPLSAPAVKTVSVYSESGSGVVNFVGRVIKTGCAAGTNIWVGYQYKEIDDVWPTTGVTAGTGVKELIPIGNNLVDFSKNIEGLADGDYHFRAYVINGYGRSDDPNNYDQGVYYGIDIPVKVSSVKEAVKDPVLQWIDEEGVPYPGGAYCPDATAYVKLTYGGSKPETVVWSNSISDSNPVSVKESLGENWYKLTVEKSGDLSVSLANEYNTTGAVQADAISLTMTSRISFPTTEVIDGITTICSNDANGTKLRVTNAVVDYQYALYKVTDEAAGTSTKVAGPTLATDVNKDNLTFTIQGAEAAGKYFVQVEETVCDQTAVSQGYTTIEVIDASAITLTLEPNEVTVNPWLPAVLTVSITEGYDYTIDIPAPLVYTANGNVYTIKAPEPADAEYQPSSQQKPEQYGKVTFDNQEYTVTADLKTDTGSSCITTPPTSTITLTPYVEDCVSEYENQ